MLIKKIDDVELCPVQIEGAERVSVRVVFGPKDGAPSFALRQFELEPGGSTPHHAHPFEHEVVVMQGDLSVLCDQGETAISPGDMLMIPPGEKHQFRNRSRGQMAKMLCMIPVEHQQ